MSKLNVDQKTIKELFESKKADFLIPDYQRPYAWQEAECQTLWEDIFTFAFPDEDYTKFKSESDEYFLGPIVTYKNDDGKMEVIDGQQRLTTLMLLLRAFYAKFGNMKDEASKTTKESIERCIWKTDEFGHPDKTALKINSEVATDNDRDEFLSILKDGEAPKGMKSHYADNYRFFEKKIEDFIKEYPPYIAYFPTRILQNCILLPIEADNQDTALRIFSTLNDRGKPLSDADIFKAQFYKFYSDLGKKDQFIKRWKALEETCEAIFHPIAGTAMDELFSRYMYFIRAKEGNKSSTTEALRRFYERNGYSILKDENTFDDLITLADFWNAVSQQDEERFSDRILRRLFVLNYAPNSMWTYFTSVYFMQNKDKDGLLDDEAFYVFLNKIIGFIWTFAVTNPGVNALRRPVYAEMVNIIEGKPVTFSEDKFDVAVVRSMFNNFNFLNGRPITKSMLAWWAFQDENQQLLALETVLEIEHIYARNRQDKEKGLRSDRNLNLLGNKALLEKRINIRASDYRFEDKKKFYKGFISQQGKEKQATMIRELTEMARQKDDFTEDDIMRRNEQILDAFFAFLHDNALDQ